MPSPEFAFFASHLELNRKYAGKHIAIVGEEVFAGGSPREVFEKAKRRHPEKTPCLTYVPEGEVLVF